MLICIFTLRYGKRGWLPHFSVAAWYFFFFSDVFINLLFRFRPNGRSKPTRELFKVISLSPPWFYHQSHNRFAICRHIVFFRSVYCYLWVSTQKGAFQACLWPVPIPIHAPVMWSPPPGGPSHPLTLHHGDDAQATQSLSASNYLKRLKGFSEVYVCVWLWWGDGSWEWHNQRVFFWSLFPGITHFILILTFATKSVTTP